MFDLRRELCRSNVFCAENGDGRTKYLLNDWKDRNEKETEQKETGREKKYKKRKQREKNRGKNDKKQTIEKKKWKEERKMAKY